MGEPSQKRRVLACRDSMGANRACQQTASGVWSSAAHACDHPPSGTAAAPVGHGCRQPAFTWENALRKRGERPLARNVTKDTA